MSRPADVQSAAAAPGTYRAGGTDLHARRRLGLDQGDIVDLRDLSELRHIEIGESGASVGALVRLSDLAAHEMTSRRYPALSLTAGSLATPQIRAVATVGGNLLQRTRCPYYRHPAMSCLKSGGTDCPARSGDHRHGVIFDLGACIAPHPSSLAMALLSYDDATIETSGDGLLTVGELMGDGRDGTRDHQLSEHALLTAVRLPPPVDSERAAYRRATGRARAEWPMVEAVCRLVVADGRVARASVAVGAVAPVPLRLARVEEAITGIPIDDDAALDDVASLAVEGATPLEMTGHKVSLLRTVVGDVIREAIDGTAITEMGHGERGLP